MQIIKKLIDVIKYLLVRKWLIIFSFSLGGAIIGASISYFYPLPKVVAESSIRIEGDQNLALFMALLSLPKCSTNLVQSHEDVPVQVITKVKASPRDLSISVMGENMNTVENCLKTSIAFFLKPRVESSSAKIKMLEKEIIDIDDALSSFNKNRSLNKVGENLYLSYPQKLLLRKYEIHREIEDVKGNISYAWNYSTRLNSPIHLMTLRISIGALIGLLLGLLFFIFTNKSFGNLLIPRS